LSQEATLLSVDKKETQPLPDKIMAIKQCGCVNWSSKELSSEFKQRFEANHIPVVSVHNVRVWGIQVDDEREIPGLERTSIPDEELWNIKLKAKDGSTYEVNADFVVPAAE
jgi:hypothetical protein